MSVPVRDRSEAAHAYRAQAIQLQRDMTLLLLRDFGVKSKTFSVDYYSKINKMQDQDQQVFMDILAKYDLSGSLIATYPQWLIDHYRNNILATLQALCYDLTQFETRVEQIPVSNLKQFYKRQEWINDAVCQCEQLLQEMQDVLAVLPVNVNKLTPYVNRIIDLRDRVRKQRTKTNAGIKKLQ